MRLLLERRAVDPGDTGALYRAVVYTPDRSFEYDVRLSLDGVADLRSTGEPAPPALEEKLLAHARVAARTAGRKQAEGLPPWPHRVLKWRPVRG